LKSGSLILLEPSGPVQGCNGIALPLPLPYKKSSNRIALTETGSSDFVGSMPEKCTERNWNSKSCLEVSFVFLCQYVESENF
jgi:hypothetical protein